MQPGWRIQVLSCAPTALIFWLITLQTQTQTSQRTEEFIHITAALTDAHSIGLHLNPNNFSFPQSALCARTLQS